MARIRLKGRKLRRALKKAERKAIDMTDAWEDIAEELHNSVMANFEAEGRPVKWPALNAGYRAARPAGKILNVSGSLQLSVTKKHDARSATVGSGKKYAAIHQFGGKTKAHKIRPKRAKALWWPGAAHPVAVVNHPGSKIPARPFIMVQDQDWKAFAAIIQEHIVDALEGAA